jgi:RHS repeat-associated protein
VRVWEWKNADAFGNNLPDENPTGLATAFKYHLRFPGQYFDQETSTHYNYFRDYDPSTGRYVQSDPIGLRGGVSTYGYVYSRPLEFVDPLGLRPPSEGDYSRGDPARWQPGVPPPFRETPGPGEYIYRAIRDFDNRLQSLKPVPVDNSWKKYCVTAECVAGLPERPADNRTREQRDIDQCEFICGLVSPGPPIPLSKSGAGKWAGSYVGCSWFCKDKDRRNTLCDIK